MALLSEVIRQAPSVPDSYHTLGLIYEERDEKARDAATPGSSAHLLFETCAPSSFARRNSPSKCS